MTHHKLESSPAHCLILICSKAELTGGVCASLNEWPGNQGTSATSGEKYRSNSGAHGSRERPAHFNGVTAVNNC